jgi:RNA polymerase sigma-70 factor, ECF subfamily
VSLTSETDINRTLAEGIKAGNHSAFETLYKAYFEPLYFFAKDYVIDVDQSRNIVQDSFLSLWEKRDFLNVDLNLKSFLYTIVRNNSLNYLKREKNKKRIDSEIHQVYFEELRLNYEALSQLPIDKISFEELQKLIEDATEKLPPQCRLIFKMSRFDALKNGEIAEQLNISTKTVEGHITQALKSIRKQLKKYYQAEILSQIILFL